MRDPARPPQGPARGAFSVYRAGGQVGDGTTMTRKTPVDVNG
jgi:hypothetical protein